MALRRLVSAFELKAPARFLRRRFVLVDRVAEYVETAALLFCHDPIIVYSMGKAGTTAVEAALRASGRPVLKAHSLTAEGISERLERAANHADRPRFLWRTQVLRWDLRLRRRTPRTLVSAVRDPVSRAISAYFYGSRVQETLDASPDTSSLDADGEAATRYLRNLALDKDWFAEELRRVTGIDVYAEPFPCAVGYRVYDRGRFRLLVVRQEDLSTIGRQALGELIGEDEHYRLERRNTAQAGDAADRYRHFREHHCFERELLQQVYEQRLAQHFYTAQERMDLIERWSCATDQPGPD